MRRRSVGPLSPSPGFKRSRAPTCGAFASLWRTRPWTPSFGLASGGRTATHLRYRTTVSDENGGRKRLFSLLNKIETTWVVPPTTIHRRIRAVFSRTTWEVIGEPRIPRTVDLAVLRTLGPRRELARRLFHVLEAQPGHEDIMRAP